MDKILLVDDEPLVLQALSRGLRPHLAQGMAAGVHLEMHHDPVQACRRLRESRFAVVLSDFRMPAMDGIELLREARAHQPLATRMILSASNDISTVMQALNDAEVFRYLSKPWDLGLLVLQLHGALKRHHALRTQQGLADAMQVLTGDMSPQAAEMRRLEAEEPGITKVDWGPMGEVLLPPLPREEPGS
ncbi:response regulator [Aquabacterium soli]|jgi:two-component system, probable response regulator PhcQ|uniref:Response regulator n=1 Tax=Aquabacterium soli TaxID=2493092 RepID=A0A3R8TUM6_9BURK|nr:response regulator [Aquabacterium soli]RRS05114.1 response regulator [Aquabacterium soli]